MIRSFLFTSLLAAWLLNPASAMVNEVGLPEAETSLGRLDYVRLNRKPVRSKFAVCEAGFLTAGDSKQVAAVFPPFLWPGWSGLPEESEHEASAPLMESPRPSRIHFRQPAQHLQLRMLAQVLSTSGYVALPGNQARPRVLAGCADLGRSPPFHA